MASLALALRFPSRGAQFTRRLCFPVATRKIANKEVPCWTIVAATTVSSYHTRHSCWRGQGGGVLPQARLHVLLCSPSSIPLTHITLASPFLLSAPAPRHMSSLSDVLSSVFSVQASSPQTEDIGGSLDLSAAPVPPAVDAVEYIPLPPAPPESAAPALNALGEPTFESLGLGGWSPVGLIQNGLELLHVSFDLPWWGAIALATVVLRTLIFPLIVVSQRNAAKMNNYLPQLQVLQMKMSEARNSGDQLNAARYSQEMVHFMKEKNLSPLRNILVPFAQAPIFISMFIGLRRMANLPVESFKDGGLWWFADLTVADPYYILPIVTSLTMLATIELGADGAKFASQNMMIMKYVLRALPFFVFPFTMNFPAAVLCYWVSTNFFSLVQVGFLRVPAIRDCFKIDRLIVHKPESLPQKKGAVEGFKESWRNMKITREIENRQRYDEMRFKKAGTGPIVRTYKHDPTKVISVQAKVKAK